MRHHSHILCQSYFFILQSIHYSNYCDKKSYFHSAKKRCPTLVAYELKVNVHENKIGDNRHKQPKGKYAPEWWKENGNDFGDAKKVKITTKSLETRVLKKNRHVIVVNRFSSQCSSICFVHSGNDVAVNGVNFSKFLQLSNNKKSRLKISNHFTQPMFASNVKRNWWKKYVRSWVFAEFEEKVKLCRLPILLSSANCIKNVFPWNSNEIWKMVFLFTWSLYFLTHSL